jgi:hypothetical protein
LWHDREDEAINGIAGRRCQGIAHAALQREAGALGNAAASFVAGVTNDLNAVRLECFEREIRNRLNGLGHESVSFGRCAQPVADLECAQCPIGVVETRSAEKASVVSSKNAESEIGPQQPVRGASRAINPDVVNGPIVVDPP